MGIRYFFLCMYLRIMINPRCAAFILPQLCRVLCEFVHLFRLESALESTKKRKNCKQIIIIAKSVKYFFFCEHFFNALKDVPGYPISVQGMQEQLHSSIESPILQISRGGLPPDPLRGWCIRHSTFVPAARTVHVRQLKYCIRYFQMLPKTPQS